MSQYAAKQNVGNKQDINISEEELGIEIPIAIVLFPPAVESIRQSSKSRGIISGLFGPPSRASRNRRSTASARTDDFVLLDRMNLEYSRLVINKSSNGL